jgi:hypothetical protein
MADPPRRCRRVDASPVLLPASTGGLRAAMGLLRPAAAPSACRSVGPAERERRTGQRIVDMPAPTTALGSAGLLVAAAAAPTAQQRRAIPRLNRPAP